MKTAITLAILLTAGAAAAQDGGVVQPTPAPYHTPPAHWAAPRAYRAPYPAEYYRAFVQRLYAPRAAWVVQSVYAPTVVVVNPPPRPARRAPLVPDVPGASDWAKWQLLAEEGWGR